MFKVSVTKTSADSELSWHKIKLKDEISRLRFELEEQIRDSKQNNPPNLLQNAVEKPSEPLEAENKIYESINQPVEEIIKNSTLMVCYDSGGQAEFFDVMPLLATNPTGYIMVLDMLINLDASIMSKANIEGKDYSSNEIASKVLMKNAIASIHSGSGHTARHNVLVVGTHLDKCKNPQGKITELDNQICEDLVKDGGETLFRVRSHKENKAIDSEYIHPVANVYESQHLDEIAKQSMEEITKQSVEEIRTAVEDMSKMNMLYNEISIKSHLFLLEIQLKLKNPPHYLTKEDYKEYAKACVIPKEEVDKLLEYFHELGFVFYFKEDIKDVVFSPQWVFDRLSDIIFEKYKPRSLLHKDNIKKGKVTKDMQFFHAIFRDEVIKKKVYKITEEDVNYLCKIFLTQHIMAELRDDENNYFMPALLSPISPDDESVQEFLDKNFERVYERLYVKFDKHYFPRVIFCYLANKLMGERNWKIHFDLCYSNILVFQTSCSVQYVGLFDYNTELVVELHAEKGKDFRHEKSAVEPHEISGILFQFITDCCEKIKISNNFKYGFICNKNNCESFANVKLQYPYLIQKRCKSCASTDLIYDELIWLISPQVADIMLSRDSDSDDNLGDSEELYHTKDDGKNYFDMKMLKKAENAVCLLRKIVQGKKSFGTGFIGRIKFKDDKNESAVLVTCYHVIVRSMPDYDKYWCRVKLKDISDNDISKIEEHAKNFKILINNEEDEAKEMYLEEILVEGSCEVSPKLVLDYFIVKINEEKLRTQWTNLEPIDLNNQTGVKNNDQIYILHHPEGNKEIQISTSNCQVIKSDKDVVHYMVYTAATDPGSSGGPILKEVGQKLLIAGMHQAGEKSDWDGRKTQGYNHGSLFIEIHKSIIEKDWHQKLSDPPIDKICKAVRKLKS